MTELRWYLLLIGAVILAWIYFTGRKQSKAAKHDVFRNVEEGQADVLLTNVEPEKPAKSFEEALAEVNSLEPLEIDERREPELGDVAAIAEDSDEIVIDTAEHEPRLPDVAAEGVAEERQEVPEQAVAEEHSAEMPAEEAPATAEQTAAQSEDQTLQLVMLYVVAPEEKPFPGRAVLKAFHAHKLRFGEHDIFHRETSAALGRRPVFSISNMLKPGTLVPNDLQTTDVKGLGIFMQIPGPLEPIDSFKEMLHTAQHLASTLEGELRDDTLQPLTQETIDLLRKQLVTLSGDASRG